MDGQAPTFDLHNIQKIWQNKNEYRIFSILEIYLDLDEKKKLIYSIKTHKQVMIPSISKQNTYFKTILYLKQFTCVLE